ncbi:TIGR00255 family protein [Ruminococcaceae bacterium YRB3002]|nr:TIGR00255 family protein [Ruminococcaceae bacterium YRB3002]
MAYSMTGYGRGENIYESRRYTVEIKSVNSRYCDVNIRLPRIFNFADSAIRKTLSDRLVRGKIDMFINYEDTNSEGTEVVVNEGLTIAYSEAVKKIASITGREDDLGSSRLASYQDVIIVRQADADEDRLMEELMSTVNMAIDGMLEMRKAEGNNLAADIMGKIASLEELRNEIEKIAPSVVEDYRQRLSDRIDALLVDEKREFYDESRLAAEVAVFADKCCIDEEMKRLISHFAQAKKILSSEGTVGKKMDFLVQEINREINTTGSKANDIEITNRVLRMKNLVEEIREQIQNLV